MSAYVTGHKNPDTDSVVSAISAAELYRKRGFDVIAAIQGNPAPETVFVLERFDLALPSLINDAIGKTLYLVDFSDYEQAPENARQAVVAGIVDHHKLGDVTTSAPLEAWIWPVGCTATVLKNMFDFYGIEISRSLAGGMLCAILSDTVMFKSPTCTPIDRKTVEVLAEIAGVASPLELGMEMFRVKSSIDGTSPRELVFRDFKDFNMNGKKVGVGQLELVDLAMLDDIRDELYEELLKVKQTGKHSVCFLLTDIMKEGSELLVISDEPQLVENAFDIKLKGNSAWLPGVMSRKKQIIPNLEKVFKK